MHPFRTSLSVLLAAGALATGAAHADDGAPTIEQALAAARQAQRGVTLYVQGQALSGAVVRVDNASGPGWVELRSQQYGRIVVRLDRIDGVAQP